VKVNREFQQTGNKVNTIKGKMTDAFCISI